MIKNSLSIREINQSDLFKYGAIKLNKNCFRFFICLLIFFLEVAQAQDSHRIDSITAGSCDPNIGLIPQEFTDIMETLSIHPIASSPDELSFFSASEEEVSHYSCQRKVAPSLEEMEDWLDNYAVKNEENEETNFALTLVNNLLDTFKSEKINGRVFEEESPKMLNLFKKLNDPSFHHSLESAYTPQEIKNCKKVICAMKQFYGEKQGVQLLYMLAKYGFNGSKLAYKGIKNAQYWSSDELDKNLVALSAFPQDILPIVENRTFIRNKESTEESCDIMANSFIRVFDCGIIDQSDSMYQYVVAHEVAHVIGEERGLHDSPEWWSFVEWEKTTVSNGDTFDEIYKANHSECLVSQYGETNPIEDFAESVTAYRYNPERMKENCPQKYSYLKDKVFNGWEYVGNRCFKSEESNSS